MWIFLPFFFFLKEKYKRALADTENLRQRSQKLVEEAKLYGNFKHYMILILGNMDKEVGVCGLRQHDWSGGEVGWLLVALPPVVEMSQLLPSRSRAGLWRTLAVVSVIPSLGEDPSRSRTGTSVWASRYLQRCPVSLGPSAGTALTPGSLGDPVSRCLHWHWWTLCRHASHLTVEVGEAELICHWKGRGTKAHLPTPCVLCWSHRRPSECLGDTAFSLPVLDAQPVRG